MTIYRSPVKDAPIGHQVLHCEGASCAERFKAHAIGDDMFLCRNHGRGPGKCFSTAFTYPRKQLKTPSAAESKNGDGIFQHYHQGIDVVRRIGPQGAGDPIVSVTEGKVVHIEPVETHGKGGSSGGYGISIMIESSVPWQPEPLYFFYSHCESIAPKLALGSPVSEQQEIAKVGSTGNAGAKKPHLHFEVRTSATLPKSRSWRTEATQEGLGILRLDPLEVLRQLGPWGMSTVFFPNERLSAVSQSEKKERKPVNWQSTMVRHSKVEQSPRGGYFPLGGNNDWHSGVHLATTPDQPLVAPFEGKIVAFRLDSDPVASLEDAGHINFILIQHELSEPAAALLNPASPAVDPKATPGTPGKPKASSVGRGGTNEAELVLHVKNGLHARMSPSGSPFYAPSNYQELNDSYPDDELYAAIEAFQASLAAPKASKKKKKKSPPPWPDGVMTVGGYTWKGLFGETALPMHKEGDPEGGDPIALEPDAPAGEDGGDPIAVEPEQPAEQIDPKRVVYSLLMHLGPRAVDAAAAKEFPWLSRGSITPGDDDETGKAAAQAKQTRADDKAEATYTLTRRVGFPEGELGADPAPEPGAKDDIQWVQRRLARLADYAGPTDGIWNEDMRVPLRAFQVAHTKYYGKRPDEAPGFVMPKSKKSKGETYVALRKTRVQLFGEDDDGPIDEVLLAKIRARDEHGRAAIVTGVDIEVRSGEPLWIAGQTVGISTDPDAEPRDHLYESVHWELFSEHLLVDWEPLIDEDDDRTANLPAEIYDRIELYDLPPAFAKDHHLVAAEIIEFYTSGRAEFLRRKACRFRSTWGADIPAWVKAVKALGFDGERFGATLGAYQLWPAIKGLLEVPLLWHYNPIEFLGRYAEVLEALSPKPYAPPPAPSYLRVEVRYADGQRLAHASVALAYVGEGARVAMADASGVAEYNDIPAGAGFVWIVGDGASSQVFTLDGGDVETIGLVAQAVGPEASTGALTVRVVDQEGRGLGGVEVTAVDSEGDAQVSSSDADGVAEFAALWADMYEVSCAAADAVPVAVSAGSAAQVELVRSAGAEVNVRVRYSDGQAAQGETVYLHDGADSRSEPTDDEGYATFADVIPGSYTGFLHSDTDESVELHVVERQTVVVELRAPNPRPQPTEQWATFRVVVRDDGGAPVGGERVLLLDDAHMQVSEAVTDVHGAVGFEGVAPGTYGVTSDHARTEQLGLAALAGAAVDVELRVPSITGTLHVTVAYTDGAPVHGTLKVTTAALTAVTSRALHGEGKASFVGLEARQYLVFLDGFDEYATRVDLPPGGVVPVPLLLPGYDG